MKAHINGITIEGTPQEIVEYQQMQAEKAQMKPWAPVIPWIDKQPSADTDWMRGQTTITSGDPPGSIGTGSVTNVKRCSGPCYCTGACERSPLAKLSNSFDILHTYSQKLDKSSG